MSEITQRQRAEAVIDVVKAELTPIWLGGRQRMMLVDEIVKALTTARQEALREAMDVVGAEMLEEPPTNEPDKAYCQAIDHALQALDRLAREGVRG